MLINSIIFSVGAELIELNKKYIQTLLESKR